MSVQETCDYLRKSKQTIYRWIGLGYFPGAMRVVCGNSYELRLPRSEVEAKLVPVVAPEAPRGEAGTDEVLERHGLG